MIKRIVLALLALAVTALPAFAADRPVPDPNAPKMKTGMKHMTHEHPEMKRHLMQNPQHLLAMAYHKNLVTFGKALKKVAQQGETVPRDFARAAVTEMRRSATQMEIYHEEAARNLPPDQKAHHDEMAGKMAAHLGGMRTQLAQLEELTKGDRVDSAQVLKALHPLFRGCEGMCREAGMCPEGMHGAVRPGKCGQGRGMECGCGHAGGMPGPGGPGSREMMQERQKMMDEMKAQDAEIARLVDKMNSAPNDLKQSVIADILTRMVKQRAVMSEYMERMQTHVKRHHMEGAALPPSSMQSMDGDDGDSEDADVYDDDAGAMDSDDMDSDGAGVEMNDMNMKNMKDMDTSK